MAIKYSIKDIVLQKDGTYAVTVGANKDNKGDMIFTTILPAPDNNSIDIESIARLALLVYKSGVTLSNLQKVDYNFTVS